jgi:hypothetical protein
MYRYTMKGRYQCAGWSYPGLTDLFYGFIVSEVDQAACGPDPDQTIEDRLPDLTILLKYVFRSDIWTLVVSVN